MNLLNFQLRALKYPNSVELANPESVRKLVIWLENLKIREYKIEDRKGLADTQSPNWDAAFKKYLQDLDCPLPSTDMTAALSWLVAFALNLDYEDNADKLASAAPTSQSQPAAAATTTVAAAGGGGGGKPSVSSASGEVFPDLSDPRVVSALMQLVRAVQGQGQEGPGGGASPGDGAGGSGLAAGAPLVAQVLAAAQRCVCELGPALRPGGGVWSPAGGESGGRGRAPRQALAGVPLGFEVEGEALSAAATVLRLLYIRDLRRLQSQIDHAVVEMQEYTANPKTDSSLGKVGR